MSCTCTEDKEVIGNVIIGRNKVTCQECLDAQALAEKERRKQEIIVELGQLDLKSIRPLSEGDTTRVLAINSQKVILRTELAGL